LTIKCLDLMRSAVRRLSHTRRGMRSLLCISSLLSTRIQLSKKRWSRGPTLEAIIRLFPPLVPRDSLVRSLRNLHNLKGVTVISAQPWGAPWRVVEAQGVVVEEWWS